MSMKKILVTAFVFTIAQFAKAQKDSSGNLLDDVVVTATKSPKKMSETGKVIKVITKDQIERSGSKDLAQILNEQVGVTINSATSNPGKDKSLYLLGATDKYTLILLDGIPLNEPAGVGGSFDLRLLSLDNVERIEILQGSQSTLYGSNAVAGVINIISKKPDTKKPQLNGLLTYGSYNSFKGNANISQKAKLLEYNLNYTYYNTDGISEAKDTTGKAGFDKDGFTQHALQGIIGINITDKFKLSPYFRYTHFKGGYDADAFMDAPNTYISSLVNTGLNGNYNYKNGSLHFNYGYDFTKRDYRSSYAFQSSGKFNHAEAYVNQTFSRHIQMVAGLNYQSYRIKDVDSTNSIISPYISFFLHSNNGFNLELGGRYNHHNQYGDNLTYSFNPSYLIHNTVKIFANVTSGFRAPYENLNRQHDYGVQAEVNYNNKNLQLSASYAYITGKLTDKTSGKDTSYFNLVRRPKNAVKLFAGYDITPSLYVSTTLQVTGKRTDNYFDPETFLSSQVDLNAYTLWGAYIQYSFLKKHLNVFVDIKNIANTTNYYEVYGYAVQGTTVNAGLRFKL